MRRTKFIVVHKKGASGHYECHIAECDQSETAYSKLSKLVEKHIRQTVEIEIYKVSGRHLVTYNYPEVESYVH